MKKVVFHINSLEQGGAERVVTTLANRFAKDGYEVIIATEWFAENEFVPEGSVKRVHVGLSEEQKKAGRKRQFFLRIANLRKFLKKEKPDIVIAFAKKAIYRALMATFFLRIPVLISVRANPYTAYVSKADKILIPLLFGRAKGCVFQTQGAKEFFSPKIGRKSKIILNPINEKYLHEEPAPKRRKTVVHSGRINGAKNQLMLLNAFLMVHEKHPDYDLEIYGGDSGDGIFQKLENFIRKQDAGEYIRLMGASDNLNKQLKDAALFAFSSDREGLPNSLMEAMALGLPVVATDCPCGGPATLIQDGENGLLTPVKDAKAMAAAMSRIIEDPALAEKLGANAGKIREVASEEKICKMWEEYVEELTN